MLIAGTPRAFPIGGSAVRLSRDPNGVLVIDAASELEVARGLGFAHAVDRGLQLLFVRLIAQGRLSELAATDEAYAVDVLMRQMAFAADAAAEAAVLTGEARALVEAYGEGVNTGLGTTGTPWELRLAGHRPERWRSADTFASMRLVAWFGLAQSQQNSEKLIVEAIVNGADLAKLKEVFAPHLDDLDDALAGLIARVNVAMGFLPNAGGAAALVASNNWAVAPRLSASGGALLCGDPHLEVNRHPAVWYEAIARLPGDFRAGITIPGMPAFVMGRTSHIASTITYGFMDVVDYFLEDVEDGRYLRGRERRAFETRRETIRRKGKPDVPLLVHENDAGVLETPPVDVPPRDGLHLVRALAGRRSGAALVTTFTALWRARTVAEAQDALSACALSANIVLADRGGSIGYQQTGLLPLRARSGLYPLPAWEEGTLWHGFADPSSLVRITDPPEGFLCSANDTWNREGGPLAVNLSMGDSRSARIRELLGGRSSLTLDDMKAMQRDVFSRQADAVLAALAPHLPKTPAADLLAAWDRRYDAGSKGAVLFERLYARLLDEVFGRAFGARVWRAFGESTVRHVHFHLLDRVLLHGDEGLWFGTEGRVPLFARVAGAALAEDPARVPTWGEVQRMRMNHVFFGGKLPLFLGFDTGPVGVEGSRGSILQGQLYTAGGRTTCVGPSWRFVADLTRDDAETALPGGPSDRRFSPLYRSDLAAWREYRYKRVSP